MDTTDRRLSLRAMLLAAVAYTVIGVVFAFLPGPVRLGRIAAWLASAVVGLAHISYERLRLGHAPRRTALGAAAGVALGAFGLAAAANVHELVTAAAFRPRLLASLVAWPLVTAVPVFFIAFAAAAVLRVPRTEQQGTRP